MTELLIMKAKLKVTITNWEQVSSLILLLNFWLNWKLAIVKLKPY